MKLTEDQLARGRAALLRALGDASPVVECAVAELTLADEDDIVRAVVDAIHGPTGGDTL